MIARLLSLFSFFIFPLMAKNFIDSHWMHCDLYQSSPICEEDFHDCCSVKTPYPHFENNPWLTRSMKKRFYPYLMPLDHPLKLELDALFSTRRVTENATTLVDAGFVILRSQLGSFVTVARHPDFPGIIFKLYLDSETRLRYAYPGWYWLANRCEGAMKIAEYIKDHHIKYFGVPDKWLYLLPVSPPTNGPIHQPVIIVETDMNLVPLCDNKSVWKELNNKAVLDELYKILSKGYGSCELAENIPYSQNGQFVFIDTEYPRRDLSLKNIKSFFSNRMEAYWDQLTSD